MAKILPFEKPRPSNPYDDERLRGSSGEVLGLMDMLEKRAQEADDRLREFFRNMPRL